MKHRCNSAVSLLVDRIRARRLYPRGPGSLFVPVATLVAAYGKCRHRDFLDQRFAVPYSQNRDSAPEISKSLALPRTTKPFELSPLLGERSSTSGNTGMRVRVPPGTLFGPTARLVRALTGELQDRSRKNGCHGPRRLATCTCV